MPHIVAFFSQFAHDIAVIIMGMAPILEMRLSLPVALLIYKMPVWESILMSVIGNMIPTTLILFFGEKFHRWVEKNSGFFFGKAWAKYLNKAHNSFVKYEKFGLIGLFVFIAVSLPGTGPYTAALVAFILGIPIKKSWPYVFAGVVASAIVITSVTVGLDKIF